MKSTWLKEMPKDVSQLATGRYCVRLPKGNVKVFTVNNDPDMTDQSFKKETEVHHIMNQWEKTGTNPHPSMQMQSFVDLSETGDLLEAHTYLKEMSQAFAKFPSHVREKFDNDPTKLIPYLQDPKNYKEAVQMGLIDGEYKEPTPPPPAPTEKKD